MFSESNSTGISASGLNVFLNFQLTFLGGLFLVESGPSDHCATGELSITVSVTLSQGNSYVAVLALGKSELNTSACEFTNRHIATIKHLHLKTGVYSNH